MVTPTLYVVVLFLETINFQFLSSVSVMYCVISSTETFIDQSFLTTKEKMWFIIQVFLGQAFKYIYLTFESVGHLS